MPGRDRARLGLGGARLDRAVDQRAAANAGSANHSPSASKRASTRSVGAEVGACDDLAQPGGDAVAAAAQERGDERLLGVEVAIERDLRDAGPAASSLTPTASVPRS